VQNERSAPLVLQRNDIVEEGLVFVD